MLFRSQESATAHASQPPHSKASSTVCEWIGSCCRRLLNLKWREDNPFRSSQSSNIAAEVIPYAPGGSSTGSCRMTMTTHSQKPSTAQGCLVTPWLARRLILAICISIKGSPEQPHRHPPRETKKPGRPWLDRKGIRFFRASRSTPEPVDPESLKCGVHSRPIVTLLVSDGVRECTNGARECTNGLSLKCAFRWHSAHACQSAHAFCAKHLDLLARISSLGLPLLLPTLRW